MGDTDSVRDWEQLPRSSSWPWNDVDALQLTVNVADDAPTEVLVAVHSGVMTEDDTSLAVKAEIASGSAGYEPPLRALPM